MDKKERKIAVFDSGVGGISVLKELMAIMPEEHYLYFGDSINAPYGTRTTEEVRVLSLNAAAMLYERGIKALVVACNTATAAAITQIRAAPYLPKDHEYISCPCRSNCPEYSDGL